MKNNSPAYRQRLGKWGETLAESFLCGKGLVPVAKNLHTRYGEIDLLLRDQDSLVFVEVKTRTSLEFGAPEESITPKKKMAMIQSAEAVMQEHPEWSSTWRIDVVSIHGRPGDPQPEILWFENAVA